VVRSTTEAFSDIRSAALPDACVKRKRLLLVRWLLLVRGRRYSRLLCFPLAPLALFCSNTYDLFRDEEADDDGERCGDDGDFKKDHSPRPKIVSGMFRREHRPVVVVGTGKLMLRWCAGVVLLLLQSEA